MFQKLSIFSLALFILAGNFKTFPAIESLPVDISILAMIIPALYFLFHTITKMRINKSFFMIVAFGFANTPNLLLQDNSLEKIIFFLLIFLVLTIVSPVILKSDESKTLFVKYLLFLSVFIAFLPLMGFGRPGSVGRLTLYGGNPIGLARAVSIAGLILIVRLFFYDKVSLFKFILLAAPVSYVLLSTGSKGPLVSMIVALLVVYFGEIRRFFLNKRFIRRVYPLLAVGVIAIVFLYFSDPNSPILRLFNLNADTSTITRASIYKDSLRLIAKYPTQNSNDYSIAEYPHNAVLEAFVELGWIAGLFFTVLIGLKFYWMAQTIENKYRSRHPVCLFCHEPCKCNVYWRPNKSQRTLSPLADRS